MPAHRNRDGAVAVLENVAANPFALVADHQRDLAGEIDRVGPLAVLRRGVNPIAALLQRLDGARKVGHLRHVAQVTNLSRAIETLKKSGYWIYAAAENGERPDAIDFTGKVALVVGNEGKGIRRNVLEHCDRTVTIPMSGHVGSFNVATATAILCYEVRRQQR